MPEREALQHAANSWHFFTDRTMWVCVALVVAGTVARVLKNHERVDPKTLVAEAVLGGIGAIGIYAGAEMQGLDFYSKILCSVLMSLGGIHGIQRAFQVFQSIKGGQ